MELAEARRRSWPPVRTVVLAGDSITEWGRDREDPTDLGHGYVRLVADALARGAQPPRVVNRGVGGDRLADLERRWEADVLAEQPDLVSVLIGVNDAWRRYDGGEEVSAADFAERYGRLLQRLPAQTRLVLVEPFVVPVTEEQARWREDLGPKAAVVRDLAERSSAVLVPAAAEMARRAAEVGAAALAEDGVHPTPLGHRVLAELWLRSVGAAA